MVKAALYSRVSTEDKGQDNEVQLRELRAFCQRIGYDIYNEYCDVGESGAKRSRPALNEMMQDANKKLFDVVVVWKLDRLSRSLGHLIETLNSLNERKIGFVCLTQDIDTTTAGGQLMFHVIGAFAEFERQLIAERVKAGLAKRKADGKGLGRQNLMTEEMRKQLVDSIIVQHKEGKALRKIEATYRTKHGKERKASLGFVQMTVKNFNTQTEPVIASSDMRSLVNETGEEHE